MNELYHHGIKGQKWGVRRYQNEDGTLTSAGKKRYAGLINDHMKGHMKFTAKNGDVIELRRKYPSGLGLGLAKISSSIRDNMKRNSDFDVYANGKKVGNVELYQEGKKSINGTWLGIDEKYRGRGYASAVLNSVIDYAKEAGNDKMTLEVPGISPDARHIYEKVGFKAIKQISDDDDVWGGLTAMELDLHPNTELGKRYAHV